MSSKKPKKKQAKKTEIKNPPKLIEEGNYTLVMSQEEIMSSIQILSFAKGVFEQMAVVSHKEGNKDVTDTWIARAKLALVLSNKLCNIAKIGEPTSREVH